MLRARLILTLLLGTTGGAPCLPAQGMPAQAIPAQSTALTLKDGQSFHTAGRLEVVYRGWQRFLVLRIGEHTADFDPGSPPLRVNALELNTPGQTALLAEHAGETVDVSGTLQLDHASPFFWNGVVLLAQTVTLPGGNVLRSQRVQPRVPPGTDLYTVTVAMVPHQFEWRREAHDLVTGDLLPDGSLDGCSLNGAGDGMNCLCVERFTPIRAGIVPQPLPVNRWREIPALSFALPGMAQVSLPDPSATHPQVVQVACKRKGLTPK